MSVIPAIKHFVAPDVQALSSGSMQGQPISPAELRELSGGLNNVQPAENGGSFGNMMTRLVGEVSDKQSAAGAAMEGLLKGDNVSLHQAMIAMEEASVSFQLMVEVRNKLLESYQELMRMQV